MSHSLLTAKQQHQSQCPEQICGFQDVLLCLSFQEFSRTNKFNPADVSNLIPSYLRPYDSSSTNIHTDNDTRLMY